MPTKFQHRTPATPGADSVPDIEQFMPPPTAQRPRKWEQKNRAFSYAIPAGLHDQARELQAAVASIAAYDAAGNLRNDATTVDRVAEQLADWALKKVAENPSLITPRANPRGRGQMTVMTWELVPTDRPWENKKVELRKAPQRAKSGKSRSVYNLSYRWPASIDQRIRELAGVGQDNGQAKNPLKYVVPLGEIVIALLRMAVDGYVKGRFILTPKPIASVGVGGWENVQK